MAGDSLNPDFSNLALILNGIRSDLGAKNRILQELLKFCCNMIDYGMRIVGSRIQLLFHEKGKKAPIPASFLSDGALHHLCLLAILLHSSPPPLVVNGRSWACTLKRVAHAQIHSLRLEEFSL
jgi:predicted ATPase